MSVKESGVWLEQERCRRCLRWNGEGAGDHVFCSLSELGQAAHRPPPHTHMSAPGVLLPPLASPSREQLQYSFHSRVMVAATLILCIVVFFVVSLHVYAKWFWRRGGAGAASLAAPGDDAALWRLHRRHLPAEFVDVRSTPAPPISLGLDPATINSLPTFIHHPSSPRKQHDDTAPLLECAVCLSEFESLEKGRILPDCKHRFHIGCIDVWLRSHSTCPLCRVPVSPWIPRHFEQTAFAQTPNSPSQFAPTSFLLLPISAHRQGERATALSGLPSIAGYGCPIERPSTRIAIAVPGNPENLVHGHHFAAIHSQPEAQASSKHMANSPCESSCSTKSTSEFQLQGDSGASIARCQSLGVPGRPSEDTESCGLQPVKSRSFHKPIKWLISRDLSRGKGRIFPSASSGEGAEEQGHQVEQSSSKSTGLPV